MGKKMFFICCALSIAKVLVFAEDATPTPEVTAIPDTPPSYEHAFFKMLMTLGGLLLLVFLTIFALKKLSHGKIGGLGSQKKIKVLEKRPISPKSVLYLVEIDHKQVLIAESQFEVRKITELSAFEEEQS